MANRLLRRIAVKIGAGLATAASAIPRTRQPLRQGAPLSPILTRIQNIESRVNRVEHAPPRVDPAAEEIAALGTLVSSQREDIAELHDAMRRIEHRSTVRAEALEQKVALVEQLLPGHIETNVNARMAELEQRLRDEFQESHNKIVDAFVATIDSRVVGRIAAIENNLVEQAQSIASLREKSIKTDDNLQRLLVAVEKLCARADAEAQITVPEPRIVPEPPKIPEIVESHLRRHFEPAVTELEQAFAFIGAARNSLPPRFAMGTVGMAILGLAVVGFRLFR
jgi:hypothetical protein